MITEPLNREAAEELFKQEAIVMSGTGAEGIAQYRIVELFGEPAALFMSRCMSYEGYLVGGRDYNATGAASTDRPMLYYFYKAGFMKIVAEHNYLLSLQAHRASEGGSRIDALWKEREAELEEAPKRKKAAKSLQNNGKDIEREGR